MFGLIIRKIIGLVLFVYYVNFVIKRNSINLVSFNEVLCFSIVISMFNYIALFNSSQTKTSKYEFKSMYLIN